MWIKRTRHLANSTKNKCEEAARTEVKRKSKYFPSHYKCISGWISDEYAIKAVILGGRQNLNRNLTELGILRDEAAVKLQTKMKIG